MLVELLSLCSIRFMIMVRSDSRVILPEIVAESQVATYDMFEESDGLCFHELVDHVTENRPDSIEPLVGMTDVGETGLI